MSSEAIERAALVARVEVLEAALRDANETNAALSEAVRLLQQRTCNEWDCAGGSVHPSKACSGCERMYERVDVLLGASLPVREETE